MKAVLKNKVGVVTGAGSGIGRALALQLAKRGCHVALADLSQERLDETEKLMKAYSVSVSKHICNVANKDEVQALALSVFNIHQRIDLVFNNAGIVIEKSFDTQTIEDWEKVVGVNFWGVVYGCKYFLPYLQKSDEAFVVNTSSLAGFVGFPTQSAYCATKAAVKALNETLYAELKHKNIHVCSVHPGAIRTNIFEVSIANSDDPEGSKAMFDLINKFAMSPDKAAEKIISAVERKKMRVLVGIDAHLVDWVKRLLPVSFHYLLAWAFKRRKGI